MNALATIHVAKKELGLDDETYRAVLVRVTGKSSAGEMNEAERQRVVEELRRQGFKRIKYGLEGPFAKKLQALWIAAWNLGLVRDRRDAAMLAFVKRQTGIEHTRFLRNPGDAAKAIEAMKAWMAREGGVDWSEHSYISDWRRQPGARIAIAQWAMLARANAVEATLFAFRCHVEDHFFNPLETMTAREWAGVMNRLGERIRAMKR
ncbi:regulatory protein GemA [Nitratireductor soli]|uniref:regulatory protein GemA n=1 Tax=Nitratireductor soli TaxID=1670619 RepID=UPI00065E8FEA|nr:regulatory protein GemA [Nitratireductor soli]